MPLHWWRIWRIPSSAFPSPAAMVVPIASAPAPPVTQPLWNNTPVSIQPPPRTRRPRRRNGKNSWYHRFIVSTQDTMSNSLATPHPPRAIAPKSSNQESLANPAAPSQSSSSSSASTPSAAFTPIAPAPSSTVLSRPSSNPSSLASLPNQPVPHMPHLRVLLPKPPDLAPTTYHSSTSTRHPTPDALSFSKPHNSTPVLLTMGSAPSALLPRPASASEIRASPSTSTVAAAPASFNREESSPAIAPSIDNTGPVEPTMEAPSIQPTAHPAISTAIYQSQSDDHPTDASPSRPRGKQISLPLRATIVALHERAKWSFSDLEKNLGIPMSTLRHIVQRTKERAGRSASFLDLLEHLHDLPRSGRPGKRRHATDDEESVVFNPRESTVQSDSSNDINEETFVSQSQHDDRPSSPKRRAYTRTPEQVAGPEATGHTFPQREMQVVSNVVFESV